ARDQLRMWDKVPPLLLVIWSSMTVEEWRHVIDVGLIGILHYRHIVREMSLMVTFINRWDSETNTFRLLT
ncbi:hypothetical protein KI387_002423, partial [Taxus chinensis]